ncbi:MAG: tryptophan 7-halogenase [Flammeovirgaceae bacterium]
MNLSNLVFDVIVIGGGPAGSSLSTFVAKEGFNVLLLEKEKFPRYHIGESLLPVTVHGICDLLGVKDELDAFKKKGGGLFLWGNDQKPWTFDFDSLHAYQVERADFDHLLLKNAQKHGVTVREEASVFQVEKGEELHTVYFKDTKGATQQVQCKYLADCSGGNSRIAKLVSEREYSKFFNNVAIWKYFDNCADVPNHEGWILNEAFDEGWFWFIPLSNGLLSVGLVVDHELVKNQQPANLFEERLAASELFKKYFGTATPAKQAPYDQLRVCKDYSYCRQNFYKDRILLAGDAACFIDPVFSSGVHLATLSGYFGALSINSVLKQQLSPEEAFSEYEQRYFFEFKAFYEFLLSFYDSSQSRDSYFWQARKVLNSEDTANESEAFLSLITGISSGVALDTESENVKNYFSKFKGIGNIFRLRQEQRDDLLDENSQLMQFYLESRKYRKMQGDTILNIAKNHQHKIEEDSIGKLIPAKNGFYWQKSEETLVSMSE